METAPTMREMYERVSDHLPLSYQYSLRSLFFAVFMAAVAGKGAACIMRQSEKELSCSNTKAVPVQNVMTTEELMTLRTPLSRQGKSPRTTASALLRARQD